MNLRHIPCSIFVFVFILLHEASCSSRCTVCPDKSPVSKPDAFLDVPGIGTLQCSVIDSLVGAVYKENHPDCQRLHSVSSVCGCPSSAKFPCRQCGEDQVSESRHDFPMHYLDETFDYKGINCRMMEAYLYSSIEDSETICKLGQSWTKDYCCSSKDWIPPTNPCQVCVETPDEKINFGKSFSCAQIQETSFNLWDEADPRCEDIKAITGTVCGCQESKGEKCTLCTDGSSVATPNKLVPFLADHYDGIEPTCKEVEGATKLFDVDYWKCEHARLIGSYCGCPAVENPCVFCPNPGDSITTPTRRHINTFEYIGESLTCEQLEATMLQHSGDDELCFLAQEHNWECGCNDGFYGYMGTETIQQQEILHSIWRVSGALSICGALLILQDFVRRRDRRKNLYRQIMVMMACFDFSTAMAWVMGSFPIPATDIDGNDTNIFGANGNDALCKAQGFFVMLGYGSGFYNISLSAYYTLVIVYNWKEYQMRKVRLWLLCLPIVCALTLACSALPHYAHVWVGCWVRPRPFGVNNAASDFTIPPIAIITIITTACQIRVYFSVRETFRKAERWSMNKRLAKKKAEGGITAGLTSSTLDPSKISFQNPSSTFDPRSRTQQPATKPRRKCCQDAVLFQDNAEAAVFWQSGFYLFIYYLCWPILGVAVNNGGSQSYGFWLTFSALAPLQGFFNCLIYFRPRYVNWRKARRAARERQRRISRKNKLSAVGMSTNTTASNYRRDNNTHACGGSNNTPDQSTRTEHTELTDNRATGDGSLHSEDQVLAKSTYAVPEGSAWALNVNDTGKDAEEQRQDLNASDRGKEVEEQSQDLDVNDRGKGVEGQSQDSIMNDRGKNAEEQSQQVAEEDYIKTYPSLS